MDEKAKNQPDQTKLPQQTTEQGASPLTPQPQAAMEKYLAWLS
jgi:hypothetical protein